MRRTEDRPAQLLKCFAGWREHFRAPAVELYDEPGANPSREDRCLIRATGEWLEWLEANSQGPYPCLWRWNHGIARHNPLESLYPSAVTGWRGTRPFAAIQIIHHSPFHLPGETWPLLPEVLEVDFDLSNPGRGLLPAVGHAAEWLWLRLPRLIRRPTRKTNPYRIARLMRRAGIDVEVA